MVVVEPVPGVTYYMDDRLKGAIDKKLLPLLHQKDEDFVIVIDGEERAGKSLLGMNLGKYIDPSLDVSRICFSSQEFRQAIINAKQGQVVIFDEAFRGFSSRGALSEVNKILVSLMMETGQKNLCIIIILPTFYLLDKYIALWRARVLFHVYKVKGRKGYWRLYNRKKKMKLYLDPKGKSFYQYRIKTDFSGRFYGKYPISEEAYRKKKAESLRKEFETVKVDRYLDQRDKIIYSMYKFQGMKHTEIAKLFEKTKIPLQRRAITVIINKMETRLLKLEKEAGKL